MFSFILFVISFLLVCLSSAFLVFSLNVKKISNLVIYFALIVISQVIITFEVLSILKSINSTGVLIFNIFLFILTAAIWFLKNRPIPNFKESNNLLNKCYFSIKTDKILLVLSVLFVFSCLISLFFVIFVPTNNWDSHAYRLTRVALWVQNQTLEHFETTNLRLTIFPINSELMFLWPHVFVKRDYLSLFPAFFSYFASLGIISIFLRNLRISIKRILWVILIVGSIPLCILEMSSTQSELFLGFLLLSSLYLFFYSVKNNDKLAVFFSALAYSVALGVKSIVVFFIPALVAIFILLGIKEIKKDFYKPIIKFALYFIPLFLLLSSYNYILTYQEFGNVFGPVSFISNHLNASSETYISSLLLYLVSFLDFSGINTIASINPMYLNLLAEFFNNLHFSSSNVVAFGAYEGFNVRIHENYSFLGLLGCLLIFPAIIFAFTKITSKRNRTFYLSICGIFLVSLIFILVLTMGFSVYFLRFFTTAIILTAPVLVFSYSKNLNIYKVIISMVIAFNYIVISLFNNQKPFFTVINLLPKSKTFNEYRDNLRLIGNFNHNFYQSDYFFINNIIKRHIPDNAKIGLIFGLGDIMYPFFEINPTWKLYPVRYDQLLKRKNFNDYDYLITNSSYQTINPLTQDVKFKYYPDPVRHWINFNEEKDEAKIIYKNKKGQIIFAGQGQPVTMNIIIEDEKLLKHYKILAEMPPWFQNDKLYRIYKNKKLEYRLNNLHY